MRSQLNLGRVQQDLFSLTGWYPFPGSVQPSKTLLTEYLFGLGLRYPLLNIWLKAPGNICAYFWSSFALQLLQFPAPQGPAVSATQICFLYSAGLCLDSTSLSCSVTSAPRQKAKRVQLQAPSSQGAVMHCLLSSV